MTSSSTAPEAPRSAWIDGVATLAMVASAWEAETWLVTRRDG
jgi:hypothetical protein